MAMPLLVTTMLGSGMRSFAGSVLLRPNRRMRGNRRGRVTRLSSIVIVIAIGATVTTTAIGIAGSRLA
jgi:hypothetical protein